jgi:hypothetical protein
MGNALGMCCLLPGEGHPHTSGVNRTWGSPHYPPAVTPRSRAIHFHARSGRPTAHRWATRTYTGRPPDRTLRIESCSSDRSLRAGAPRRARPPPSRRSRTSNRRRDPHTSRRAVSPASPRRPPPLPIQFESRTLPSAVRRRVDTVQPDPAEMMPRKATRMPAAKIAAAKWMSEVAWPLYHQRRRTEAAHCGPRRCNKVGRTNVL